MCFFHTNELPLRHLIADLDGKTNSDHTFSGPLGKALSSVVYYPLWFEAKVKINFTEGSKLVLKQLELVRLQNKKVRDLVAPHIKRLAW